MFSESEGTPFPRWIILVRGLRRYLVSILTSGLPENSDAEPLHRVKITNGLAALAATFFLVFSLHHLYWERWISAIVLAGSGLAMLAVMGYLRATLNQRAAALLFYGAAFVVCMVRLHHSPPNSFGFLWSIMMPLLAIFTLGHRLGLIAALVHIGLSALVLYLPENPLMMAKYADGFRERFVATLLGTLATAYYVEYARTRATLGLQSSEHRFRAVIDNSVSVYAIVGADGTVLYESPSLKRVYGYDPEELVGTNILEQVHPDHQDMAMEEMALLIQNPGMVRTVETRYRHKDGTWRDIEVAGVNLLHDPVVGGMVLTSHDITERKRAEREIRVINQTLEDRVDERTEELRRSEARLRQSEKMEALGQLAGGIAHDFNNQLTAILSCLEMLSMKSRNDPSATAALRAATSAARRAADLTSQMLAFARKSGGSTEPVDLRTVVHEVISLLKHTIDKRITIRQELANGSHMVVGNPTQLHSALLNLAINARDAMPEGGELRFSSRIEIMDPSRCETEGVDLKSGRYVVLSVKDTGKGLTEEVRKRLFEPFFTTKPAGMGTGMGLAAVYGTAKLHGGAVTADDAPGGGAVFRFYLPLCRNAKKRPLTPAPLPAIGGRGLRILIVDDEPAIRETFQMTMEALGHQVTVCADGSFAIDVYREKWRELDAVVLDMMMPGLSGRQTFLALKEINPDVRVLLASGYSIDKETNATLEAGAAGFVAKPFRMMDMSQRLLDIITPFSKP